MNVHDYVKSSFSIGLFLLHVFDNVFDLFHPAAVHLRLLLLELFVLVQEVFCDGIDISQQHLLVLVIHLVLTALNPIYSEPRAVLLLFYLLQFLHSSRGERVMLVLHRLGAHQR